MGVKFGKKTPKTGEKPKGENKFKKVMRQIFVHNLSYKLLALGTALVCWLLTIALS